LNPTRKTLSELVYNFPIQAPFMMMHFDAYQAGKHSCFEGHDCYLIGCCGMTTFACVEMVTQPCAKTFASAIMKILGSLHVGWRCSRVSVKMEGKRTPIEFLEFQVEFYELHP
jgi:hypothetical protein